MLRKLAFLGVLGVFVNERHQDVGSDAVLVLFNGWGGLRSNGFLMAVASAAKFPNKAANSAAFHLRHAGK